MQVKTLKVYDELLGTDLAERFLPPQDAQPSIDMGKGA
jgi:hypothetical protein